MCLRAAIEGNQWKVCDFVRGKGSLASPTFCQQFSRQNPNFFHRSRLEHHTESYQSKEELTLFLFVCLEFQPPCLPPGTSCLNKHTNTRQDKHKEFKSEIKSKTSLQDTQRIALQNNSMCNTRQQQHKHKKVNSPKMQGK